MQDANNNIDLDALFDMLNIVDSGSDLPSAKSENTSVLCSDIKTSDLQDVSPLDADFFIVDLPTDQS